MQTAVFLTITVSLLWCSWLVTANMYDLFFPTYNSGCANGCADWATAGPNATYQKFIDKLFIPGTVPANASNYCAMPGASAGDHECDCSDTDEVITDSFAGPWCYCKDSTSPANFAAYCTPPKNIPEQINLQLASPTVVVAAFVTYEDTVPSQPAVAMFGPNPDSMTLVTGITHSYHPPGRTYLLHFVKFTGMKPRATYYYKVKSGSPNGVWSEVYNFRAPYSDGITRLAFYGDMGHSHYNNMGNMKDLCAAGVIDGIVHMGDHCYNMDMADDRRGDAYLNAFQPVLSGCPWYPIIGNHEASDGDHYMRYINLTFGQTLGGPSSTTTNLGGKSVHVNPPVRSTATTGLGHILTKGTLYAAGVHGSPPSNTSRYVSTDIGLLHIVGLDLNNLDPHQIAWLESDLTQAAANRANVPWIIVTSHFPIYHQLIQAHPNASLAKYMGDESEKYAISGHEFYPRESQTAPTVGDFSKFLENNLQSILEKYGVDIYAAGHIHDYETTWPILGSKTPVQKDYNEPKGVVYAVAGNGGVPGVLGVNTLTKCTGYCRTHGTGGGFLVFTAYNSTHLQADYIENPTGKITDSFVIVQHNHGPFV